MTDNGPGLGPAAEPPEWKVLRLWARENGYLVNNRGRVPAYIARAYEQAAQDKGQPSTWHSPPGAGPEST